MNISRKKLLREHKHLVKVLETKKGINKELEKQKEELEELLEKEDD